MKLYIENNEEIPGVIILGDSDPAPTGYTDETLNLISWRDHGLQGCIDYLQYRTRVTDVLNIKVLGGTTWALLTTEEKDFLIDNYIREDGTSSADDSSRKVMHLMMTRGYSQTEATSYLINAWAEFHKKEIDSCKARATSITVFRVLATYLTITDAADFTNVIEQPYYMFTTQAIRGINDGEAGEGLFDFIESTVGTSYETAGLAQQGYTMANGDSDMSNFIVDLMDVLRNANYEI